MTNTERILKIATALDELNDRVVYVGGAVVDMYADDSAKTEIRPTMDVDCVIHLTSRKEYWEFENELRKKGFENDITDGAPICRWIYRGETIDIMPDNPDLLGFSNKWYSQGMKTKKRHTLSNGKGIYIFDDAFFLATKIEAIKGRGGEDWRMSHDFEDAVYLLNYSTTLLSKIQEAPQDLRMYLSDEFSKMLQRPNIREEVECALPYEEIDRAPIVLGIMLEISQ